MELLEEGEGVGGTESSSRYDGRVLRRSPRRTERVFYLGSS